MIEKILSELAVLQKTNYEAYETATWNNDKIAYINASNAFSNAMTIVQEVAKDGGWIPVEIELPPVKENPGKYDNPTLSEDVFVIYKTHGFLIPSVAYYIHNKKCWECSEDGRKINVVKWMPIPPYQKGE